MTAISLGNLCSNQSVRFLSKRSVGSPPFSYSPAKGTWVNANREERDDIIVVEVMASGLDRTWWRLLCEQLEAEMGQTEIVMRTHHRTPIR